MWAIWGESEGLLRPRPIRCIEVDRRAESGESPERSRTRHARRGPGPGARLRPARHLHLRFRGGPRRGLSCGPEGGGDRGKRRERLDVHHPAQTGPDHNVDYDKVPLELVANSERTFPEAWISAPNKIDVTDDFLKYATPLIGEDWASVPIINGRQRFTRFAPKFAEKKLPAYELQAGR